MDFICDQTSDATHWLLIQRGTVALDGMARWHFAVIIKYNYNGSLATDAINRVGLVTARRPTASSAPLIQCWRWHGRLQCQCRNCFSNAAALNNVFINCRRQSTNTSSDARNNDYYTLPRYITINSAQPGYFRSLLSYHILAHSLRSSNTNLLSVPRVHTTFANRGSVLLSPQSGTHSLLVFALVRHHTQSIIFLKPNVSSRPSLPPSGLHKCLRFGLWPTMCTLKDFILSSLIHMHKLNNTHLSYVYVSFDSHNYYVTYKLAAHFIFIEITPYNRTNKSEILRGRAIQWGPWSNCSLLSPC